MLRCLHRYAINPLKLQKHANYLIYRSFSGFEASPNKFGCINFHKQQQSLAAIQIVPNRNYAKSKDKKKEKGKKAVKVEINEELLKSVISLDALNTQMQKLVDQMKEDFIKNLSLRSTTGSIETLKVHVDGADVELQEIAQIIRKNPKTIVINMIAFPQTIPAVLQGIQKSGMNLNPQQDGTTLYIPVPKVTKEHRESLSKNAKALFIKCRDSVKDTQNTYVKKVKKQTDVSEDDSHAVQQQIIAIADKYIQQADKLLEMKQNELVGQKD